MLLSALTPRAAGVFPRHTKRHCQPHPPRLTHHPRVPVSRRDDPSHPLPPRAYRKQRYERPSYGGLWPCVVHFPAYSYSACVFGHWQSPWRRRRYPQSHQGTGGGGVVSSPPAYVQEEGRCMLGSGRGDHGRTRIRVNIHTSADGRSGRRRRGAVSGSHSHIRGRGSGRGCSGGRNRRGGVVGCGKSCHRELRGRTTAARMGFATVYCWADRSMSIFISSSESDRRCQSLRRWEYPSSW